jgi:hypothetical protein
VGLLAGLGALSGPKAGAGSDVEASRETIASECCACFEFEAGKAARRDAALAIYTGKISGRG